MLSSGITTGEGKSAASSDQAWVQRPLCRRLRRVTMVWPPAMVQAMPEPLSRWVTKVLPAASLTPLAMGRCWRWEAA
jgi:hypothetical protein